MAANPRVGRSSAWVDAYRTAGSQLAELAMGGVLQRGARAVCAHHIIFAWNRLGLNSMDQHRLTTIATEVVMHDHTNHDNDALQGEAPTGEKPDELAAAKLRNGLVDQLRSQGALTSSAAEKAMRTVPRHLFVPDASLEAAYTNDTVNIKPGVGGASMSCASQPSIVAMQLVQLDVRPGQQILELGTGSGYNAALLAELAGESGHVTTIDIDADLTTNARAHLTAAGVNTVTVATGDGAAGHAANAPYDRIIATVGAHTIPRALIEQLAPGGLIVVPIRIAGDNSRSVTFRDDSGGRLVSQDSQLATFLPLRGGIGDDPRQIIDLTGDSAVAIQTNQDQAIVPSQLDGVLTQPARETWTGLEWGKGQPLDLMWLWLALALPNALSRMRVTKDAIDNDLVRPILPWGSMASVPIGEPGLAYLTFRQIQADPPLHELGIISHGAAGHTLAEEMADHLKAWEPHRTESINLAWYPDQATPPQPGPARFVLRREDAHLVVAWGDDPV